MRKEMKLENVKKLYLYGTGAQISKAEGVLTELKLVGSEPLDRLVIQQAIDDKSLAADILYDGNTVYGYKKLAQELKRMKKSGSIEKMTDKMYHFLSLNFDIAHFNKGGFIDYYDGRYRNMLRGLSLRTPSWRTDVAKIMEILVDDRKAI